MRNEEIVRRVSKIPVPYPGEVINIPLELFSAWMKYHRLEFDHRHNSILVVRPICSKLDEEIEMEK